MDGIEVLAVIFAKRLGITVGTFVMAYNLVLYIVCGFVLHSWILPLYSIVAYGAALKTVDFIVEGLDRSKAATIVTVHPNEVCAALSEAFECGMTITEAKGYYSDSPKTVVYIVVNRFQVGKMKELVHYADIITPNLTELCTLLDAPYPENGASIEELKEMCGKLAERGPKHIVVTGIHFNQTQIANFIYNKGEDFQIVMVDRIGGDRSGTGDVIAAIIAGMYLNGRSLYESVKKAADYVSKCIRYCEENEVPSYWGLCFEMFMKDLTEEA